MVLDRYFRYHQKHKEAKSDEWTETNGQTVRLLPSNHLLVCDLSFVLLLPLVVVLMNYTSAGKLLD